MTRFLSEALRAQEPHFRSTLRQFEQANGHPNADIRLSLDVARLARQKMAELGLDPHDTAPRELYVALKNRLESDDRRIRKLLHTKALSHVSLSAGIIDGLTLLLREAYHDQPCFSLKATSFKSMVKKLPPKRVMKQLGYRSIDSLLRHEAPALILTAAELLESSTWWQSYHAGYKKLSSRDFEIRPLQVIYPQGKRWSELASLAAEHKKTTVVSFNELAVVVLLPVPIKAPKGTAITSLITALQSISEIIAASSYLQVTQVRPDFGKQVHMIIGSEPLLHTNTLGQAVPWHVVQRSLNDHAEETLDGAMEPYLLAEQGSWQSLGQRLHNFEESLAFWHGTEHLGVTDHEQPISMHVLDVALNLCNNVPYERRITQYFQHSLWHEVLLRYMQPTALEQSITSALQPQRALAYATT